MREIDSTEFPNELFNVQVFLQMPEFHGALPQLTQQPVHASSSSAILFRTGPFDVVVLEHAGPRVDIRQEDRCEAPIRTSAGLAHGVSAILPAHV